MLREINLTGFATVHINKCAVPSQWGAASSGGPSQLVDMHEVILQARNLRTRMHNRKKEFASARP